MENSSLMETVNGYVYENYSNYDVLYHNVSYCNKSMAEDRHMESLKVLSIVIILSLIGNFLVVVISVFFMRLRSLTSIFILNLALSDLLFTVGPLVKVCHHIGGLTLTDIACKVHIFVRSAGFYSSIVFLVLISVQRYMAIMHPHSGLKNGHWFTHIRICSWIVSILAASPVLVHIEAHPYPGHCRYSSKIAFLATIYKENIVFVGAFLFMAFCYIRILQTIFKSPTNQKHRTTGLVFLLVATFFIWWAPYNIVRFLRTLSYFQITSVQVINDFRYAYHICRLLAYTRCCLNPVIYGLYGVIFQKGHSGKCFNLNNQ